MESPGKRLGEHVGERQKSEYFSSLPLWCGQHQANEGTWPVMAVPTRQPFGKGKLGKFANQLPVHDSEKIRRWVRMESENSQVASTEDPKDS